jgi:hypothetical protein
MSASTSVFGNVIIEKIAKHFHRSAVDRCLMLLQDANIGLDREPMAVSRAKDRFSNLLGKARAGEAQVIGLESAPVIVLSAESLVRLMCTASSAVTVAEALTGLPGAPIPARPLQIKNRGGRRQVLSMPAETAQVETAGASPR